MARGPYSTSDYYYSAALPWNVGDPDAEPSTFAAWFYDTSGTAQECMLHIAASTSATSGPVIDSNANRARVTNNFTSARVESGGTYSLSSWNHVAGVLRSNSDRSVYLNGARSNSTVTGTTVADCFYVSTGKRATNTAASTWLAEVAVWRGVLSDAEIASLAKGLSPKRVRPQLLAFYQPLAGEFEGNILGVAVTKNGTINAQPHPRTYR